MPANGNQNFLNPNPSKLKTPIDQTRIAKYDSVVDYDTKQLYHQYSTMDIPKRNGRHDSNPSAMKNLKHLKEL